MKRVGAGFRWAGIVGLGLLASGCMQTADLSQPARARDDRARGRRIRRRVSTEAADKPHPNPTAFQPCRAEPPTAGAGRRQRLRPVPRDRDRHGARLRQKFAAPAPSVTAEHRDGDREPLPLDAAAPAAVPKTDDDGFPNINLPPQQPEGTLLAPDERKRIIDELEALRDRQNAAKPREASRTPPIWT